MPGDLDFGPVLGSIWGPFWDNFGVKNRFESDWKKHQKNGWKKVMQNTPGPRRTPGLWPLKRDQSDWRLATGNWKLAGLGTGRPVRPYGHSTSCPSGGTVADLKAYASAAGPLVSSRLLIGGLAGSFLARCMMHNA